MSLAEQLAQRVKETELALAASLKHVSDAQATTQPEPGCWSITECLEHLYLVEKGIVRLVTKPHDQAVAGNEEVFGQQRLEKALLNRTHKIAAPDAFVPTGRFTSLNEAKTALSGLRETLLQALESNQISFDGQTYPHPVLGPFTRLDWVNFIVAHARRHQAQIEEIKAGPGLESPKSDQ